MSNNCPTCWTSLPEPVAGKPPDIVRDSPQSAAKRILAAFPKALAPDKQVDVSSKHFHYVPPGPAWTKAFVDANKSFIGSNPKRLANVTAEAPLLQGFVAGSEVYIRSDIAGKSNTELHESLHFYQSPAWRQNVSQDVDEATTEYFSRVMKGWPNEERAPEYEAGQPLLDSWVAKDPVRRQAALAKAYFGGDFGPMTALDPSLPPKLKPGGAWGTFLESKREQ